MNFYEQKQVQELMASHERVVATMEAAAKSLGDSGVRSVQLWQQAANIDPDSAAGAGVSFAAIAHAKWAANKTNIVRGIDSLALSLGMTRQQILDDLADEPATFE